MLDSVDLKVRLSKATELVDRHLQSIHVAEKITQNVQCQLSKSQKEFLLRQQMRVIKQELGDNDDLEACTEGVESFSLDKWSGKNCSMISARGLHIGDMFLCPSPGLGRLRSFFWFAGFRSLGKSICACCPHPLCTTLILCSS